MVCNTAERVRKNAGNRIRYRTRSIISDFSKEGSFQVVYRNLVIASTPVGSNAENAGETNPGYAIKAGWGKQHLLECVLKDGTTVSCLKDGAYAFDLSRQQQLAAGR
jgi:hypothetical protein